MPVACCLVYLSISLDFLSTLSKHPVTSHGDPTGFFRPPFSVCCLIVINLGMFFFSLSTGSRRLREAKSQDIRSDSHFFPLSSISTE